MEKSYFLPRVLAYLIDIFIVSMIATILVGFLPTPSNYEELQEESVKLQEQYIAGEIEAEAYIRQTALLTYDMDRATALSYIVEVALIILYFIVFQFYNHGQTLGKKIMKVQVVSIDERPLTINDYLFRSAILHSVLVNILIIILVMFIKRDYYFYVSFPLQLIQIVLLLITIFMVLFKKDGRGLHDRIAHSKVVMKD